MTKVPKRKSRLSTPPAPVDAPNNLAKPADQEAMKDLNFKVYPDFHYNFKTRAAMERITMRNLLYACWDAYIEKHGDKKLGDGGS